MRTLEFTVDRLRLAKDAKCDFKNIVAGTVGYLKAKFSFSSEWIDCVKVASFWADDEEHAVQLDANNECVIPAEVLTGKNFRVSVAGGNPGYMIKTNKINVRQEVN